MSTESESRLLRSIRVQGEVCAGMGSAMYGDVLQRVAADVEAGGVFAAILAGHENDSGRLALPLRLLGGLHRLVLDSRAPELRRRYPSTGGRWDAEAAWPDIKRVATGHADYLRAALDSPPQTNEVGRSAALIGALLHLAARFDWPIRLFEIGCSAGLNLRADYHRYRYPGGQWGPADSPVTIDDAWRGQLPPAADLQIVERHGYDIAPLDATSSDGAMSGPTSRRGSIDCAARSASPGGYRFRYTGATPSTRSPGWTSRPARSPCCGIPSCGSTSPRPSRTPSWPGSTHWVHEPGPMHRSPM
jgi:hypothetical protein